MVRNGMANSALHPTRETRVRTCHAPSQLRLNPPASPRENSPLPLDPNPPRRPPSLITCPSYSWPAGLVPKTNPFCRSLNVSRITMKLSLSVSAESRRLSATMIDDGSLS